MSRFEVIILANSIKHNQHCVAGKLVSNGQWVRPVSTTEGGELSGAQTQIKNPHGAFNVKPLQKVIMGLSTPAPLINQPENCIVDDSTWKQNYRIAANDLGHYLDEPESIWGEGDRVDYSQVQSGEISIRQSLFLVKVTNLRLFLNQYDKRRVSFTYKQQKYDFAATDPKFDKLINDTSELQGIICVSLGEPFKGNCFKLVATVF